MKGWKTVYKVECICTYITVQCTHGDVYRGKCTKTTLSAFETTTKNNKKLKLSSKMTKDIVHTHTHREKTNRVSLTHKVFEFNV